MINENSAIDLIKGEKNFIANLANLASYFYHFYDDINWCGFYLWNEDDQELVLGPFQGKPACIRIKPSRGVCGSAYATKQVQLVDNVDQFPGHIVCDTKSKSELVIPLIKNGKCVAVFDLDSPKEARFTQEMAQDLKATFENLIPLLFK